MSKVIVLFLLIFQLAFVITQVYASNINSISIHQNKILSNAPRLSPKALNVAVKGYRWAIKHDEIRNPFILTVINFNLPSDAERVWVIDLKTSKIFMKLRTTQAKNSGLYYAREFSNRRSSVKTSLGVYKTLNSYIGKHGESLRIQGLEKGINDNAYRRNVVIHPAWYVSSDFVKKYHRTGRSFGCFAVDPAVSKKFIALIKNGSVIFAYATPEKTDPNLV